MLNFALVPQAGEAQFGTPSIRPKQCFNRERKAQRWGRAHLPGR